MISVLLEDIVSVARPFQLLIILAKLLPLSAIIVKVKSNHHFEVLSDTKTERLRSFSKVRQNVLLYEKSESLTCSCPYSFQITVCRASQNQEVLSVIGNIKEKIEPNQRPERIRKSSFSDSIRLILLQKKVLLFSHTAYHFFFNVLF
jgi:hypothetical protein